jgi:pumilio RNA-binding family
MKPLVTPLLKELNGTFVVQKFANIHKKYSNEINEIIVENSPVLSTNRHGCCVIQYYLDIKDPIMTPNLLDKLVENCLLLIIDQFGNYVIQSILLMGNKNYGNKLAEKISENVVYYAKHKYSSNVVEKCFDYCDGNYRMNLMVNVQKKENLIELILDEHGNYVVQKVLLLSPPATQKKMLKLIVPAFEKLKRFPYGERVINRLVASYPIITDKNFLSEIK